MISMPKVGVLGGGQLGRMLLQSATRWGWEVTCMDTMDDSPAALFKDHFVPGNIKDYEDVVRFGRQQDIITVEIEHVHIDALRALKKMGKTIHPDPEALHMIKHKGRQKEFYRRHDLPTADFVTFSSRAEALALFDNLPFGLPCIYKAAEGGYDGKGVRTIRNQTDVRELPDTDGLFEERIEIAAELAYSGCMNASGQFAGFYPVTMEFDTADHILSTVYCDTEQLQELKQYLEEITHTIMSLTSICGLLAVEFFLTSGGKILINEIAPRPHNSMHHTIENCVTSQFEQHLRGIMNLPLGSTEILCPAIMHNIIGDRTENNVIWPEMLSWLDARHCKLHLYGKKAMKPGRKMGHLTLVSKDWEHLLSLSAQIRKNQCDNE